MIIQFGLTDLVPIPLLPLLFFPRSLVLADVHLLAIKSRQPSQETVASLCGALDFKQGTLSIVDSFPWRNMFLHLLFVFISTFSLVSSLSLFWVLSPCLLWSHTTGLPCCHKFFYSATLLSSLHLLYLCWVDKAQGHSRVSMFCLNSLIWIAFLSNWLLFLLYNRCLPMYSLIKALADSPNQITPNKQKDLLLLAIDFLLSSLFWLWLTK